MTGLVHEIDLQGITAAIEGFERLARLDAAEVMSIAVAVPLASTHERLRETRTAPDGTPWPAWSPAYATTRAPHHSLLMSEGNLDDSITEFVQGGLAGVGSNLVYAAIHQHGGAEVGMPIPAREYLGLSEADAAEIQSVLADWVGGQLQ